MAITISDIITEFGAYYKAGGQGIKDLQTQIRTKSDTDELFVTIPTTDTVLRGGSTAVTTVLQAFQKAWTPLGNLTIEGQTITLLPLKIDVQEQPDVLEQSWLGFLADGNLDRKQWPFVRWWLEAAILPQSREDWE